MIKGQKALKRAIFDVKSKIKEKDLFLSTVYNEFLSNQKDGITFCKTTGKSKLFEGGDSIAYTDGNDTFINYDSTLTTGLTKHEKHNIFCGLNLHESGHILFTDFEMAMKSLKELANGNLVPAPIKNDYEDELLSYLVKNGGNTLIGLYKSIDNSIEDGFVDRAVMTAAPGYASCLRFVNQKASHACEYRKTYEEMKQAKETDELILGNLILNYARHGEVFIDASSENEEVPTAFAEIQPFIKKAVFEPSPYQRRKYINTVFCYVFHFIKFQNDNQNSQNSQSSSQNSQGQNGQNSSGSNQNTQGNQNNQNQSQNNQGQNSQNSSESNQGNQNSQSNQNSSSNNQPQQTGQQNAQGNSQSQSQSLSEILQNLGNKMENTEKTERKGAPTKGNTSAINELKQKGMEEQKPSSNESSPSGKELEKLAEVYAESKVSEAQEKEITSQLKADVKGFLDGQEVHKKVSCKIDRGSVTTTGINKYEKEHQELDAIVRRFISDFLREIKDRQLGDTLTGLYAGKRIESRNVHRYDKKIFSRKIAPEDIPDMAVGILVDISVSMSGERLETAMKCAYITTMFCKQLNIPIFVMGHSTSGDDVVMHSYVDENSLDDKDSFRIFGMHTEGCNRDGYALRYCLKKLERINANDKLMMIISDGKPNHNGYGRDAGRDDCQKAVAEFMKKKIFTIAASIGDPAGVKYTYKDGISDRKSAVFMDLTDLKRLPKAFIKVIKEKLS